MTTLVLATITSSRPLPAGVELPELPGDGTAG